MSVCAAVPEGWELCRDGGKYLVLGQYANAGEVMVNPHTITRKQLQIYGSGAYGVAPILHRVIVSR
jgi:threonine dehydrogenase-like Zn-dependent dehydrogenase